MKFVGIILLMLVFCLQLSAEESLKNLAEELVSMRSKVESLHSEIEERKSEIKNRIASFSAQKMELEAAIEKEKMRIRQMQNSLTQKHSIVDKSSSSAQTLKPVIEKSTQDLAAYIEGGIPFKKEERISELRDIKAKMDEGLLSPHRAVSRLWTFFEDEFRLTKESGIFRQPVTINGEEKLCSVIKLGTLMLFFRTNDDMYGKAAQKEDVWVYEPITGKEEVKEISYLFDSFKKQIRNGFFTLPYALPEMEKK